MDFAYFDLDIHKNIHLRFFLPLIYSHFVHGYRFDLCSLRVFLHVELFAVAFEIDSELVIPAPQKCNLHELANEPLGTEFEEQLIEEMIEQSSVDADFRSQMI